MHETTSNERKPRGYGWSALEILSDFDAREWPEGVPRDRDPNQMFAAHEEAKRDFHRAKDRLKDRIRNGDFGERPRLELAEESARVEASLEEDGARLEAKRRLEEQEAREPSHEERQRLAAPATVGDLEDLRAEVERLSEIVARLER